MTDNEELTEYLHDMQKEQRQMGQVITQLMWHMRGSLSRQEAWTISPEERKDVVRLIEQHKEMTEKTGMPLL